MEKYRIPRYTAPCVGVQTVFYLLFRVKNFGIKLRSLKGKKHIITYDAYDYSAIKANQESTKLPYW